jgi:Undecaprenyl-phosphate glucose phosphotransferase
LSPEFLAIAVGGTDFCLVLLAAAAAYGTYTEFMELSLAEPGRHILTSLFAATVFVSLFERIGGYRLKQLASVDWQLKRTPIIWAFTVAVVLVVAFFSKTSEIYSRGWLLEWMITVPGLFLISRTILQGVMNTRVGATCLGRNIAIIGAGDEGQRLITRLRAGKDESIIIRGIFDDRKSRVPSSVCGLAVRGTTDDLLHFARQTPVDEVIIALPLDAEPRLRSLCDKMKALALDVRLSLEPLAETFRVRDLSYLGDVPILEVVDQPLKNWCALVKWIEDKALAALLLIVLAPLMAVIALLIKLDSAGPVFFAQKRFGFNNQPIRVLKYRTMYVDRADPSGAHRTVHNDPRVTRIGRYLRLLSFDELPQLINVMRGEMSLVGPRPHAIAMRADGRPYSEAVEQYLHRHRVKPGITGWAQVNGLRGEVDTLDKACARVAHDLHYIEHWSLWLDLKILLMTVGVLASRQNAY